MSLESPRPTIMVRPSFSSKVWSPEALTRRNAGMAEYTTSGTGHAGGARAPSLRSGRRARDFGAGRAVRPSRQRERQQYRPRLGLGLPPFRGRSRVRDDAGTRLDPGAPGLDDAGADRDGGVHRASAPADVPDRARIGAAPDRLELVDDLHR